MRSGGVDREGPSEEEKVKGGRAGIRAEEDRAGNR